jgi:hypothetical protein
LNAHVMWGRQKYIELSHLYAALSWTCYYKS